MADPITAVIGGAVSLGTALIGSKATRSAAQTQAAAAQQANQEQLQMYYQSREDLAPWRETGAEALNVLAGKVMAGPGEYQQSPYYNFLLQEGTKALERGAAARGKQLSGAEQKALIGYGQNLASTDYQNWLNRYYQSLAPFQSLAGVGQTATTNLANLGTQAAGNIAQNVLAGGQAQAAGQLGVANAMVQPMQWGANQLMNYAILNKMGVFNPVQAAPAQIPQNVLTPSSWYGLY